VCHKTYSSIDAAVLRALPQFVQLSLPIVFQPRTAMTQELHDLVLASATSGTTLSALSTTLSRLRTSRYARKYAQYLEQQDHARRVSQPSLHRYFGPLCVLLCACFESGCVSARHFRVFAVTRTSRSVVPISPCVAVLPWIA
jgi:hypothetical protein